MQSLTMTGVAIFQGAFRLEGSWPNAEGRTDSENVCYMAVGQNQWYHSGVIRCTTHFRTHFSGDWDVHWGLAGLLTHSHIRMSTGLQVPTGLCSVAGAAEALLPADLWLRLECERLKPQPCERDECRERHERHERHELHLERGEMMGR